MKVKCVRLLNAFGKEIENCGDVTQEREYVVLGISISDKLRIYIENNYAIPVYYDLKGFEVISNYMPSRWFVYYSEGSNSIDFYPKAWIDTYDFWGRLIDDEDPEMTELYERERNLIYAEEPKN